MSEDDLSVETAVDGPRHTVALAGELDMATAARLEAAIEQALAGNPRELVLDMRQVTFMDSTGLRAVLRARRACEEQEGDFFLLPSESGEQRQLFHVSGIIGELTFRQPGDAPGPAPTASG